MQPATRPSVNGKEITIDEAKGLLDRVLDNTSTKYAVLRKALEDDTERIARIEEVLPEGMKGQARRLAKRALMTFARRKELSDCPAPEFIRCVVEAAEVGLAIDGKLCYVVRYKSTWQCQPDYKGLIAVAKRSGQIKDCYADVVRQHDHFEAYRKNGESCLEHHFDLSIERGEVLGAYAIVKLPDGDWRYELMSRDELDKIQARAPSKSGPWSTDVNEMRKKTVIRRLLKSYCDDPAFVRASEMDDHLEDVEHVQAPPRSRAATPVGRPAIDTESVPDVEPEVDRQPGEEG